MEGLLLNASHLHGVHITSTALRGNVKWANCDSAPAYLTRSRLRCLRQLHLWTSTRNHNSCRTKLTLLDDATIEEDDSPATVTVEFRLERECLFGQHFGVVGEDALLGEWNPRSAVLMEWSDGHVWSRRIELPAGKVYEFKFVLINEKGIPEWQPGENRSFDTSKCSSSSWIVLEKWDVTTDYQRNDTEALPNIEDASSEMEIQEKPSKQETPLPNVEDATLKVKAQVDDEPTVVQEASFPVRIDAEDIPVEGDEDIPVEDTVESETTQVREEEPTSKESLPPAENKEKLVLPEEVAVLISSLVPAIKVPVLQNISTADTATTENVPDTSITEDASVPEAVTGAVSQEHDPQSTTEGENVVKVSTIEEDASVPEPGSHSTLVSEDSKGFKYFRFSSKTEGP